MTTATQTNRKPCPDNIRAWLRLRANILANGKLQAYVWEPSKGLLISCANLAEARSLAFARSWGNIGIPSWALEVARPNGRSVYTWHERFFVEVVR